MLYEGLDDPTRTSLLRGYVEHSWRMPHLASDYPQLATAEVADDAAYADGLELRERMDMLFSADSWSEVSRAEEAYDQTARRINARYGEGIVVLTSEPGEPGLRGFRTPPFSTVTTTKHNPDGTSTLTVRDLAAEADKTNRTDREHS